MPGRGHRRRFDGRSPQTSPPRFPVAALCQRCRRSQTDASNVFGRRQKPCVCRLVGLPHANVDATASQEGVSRRRINYWRLWLFDAVLVSAGVLFFLAAPYGTYEFFGRAMAMALLPFIPVMVLVGGAGSTLFALTKVLIEKRSLKPFSALALLVGPALVVTLLLVLLGAGKSPGHRLAYLCLGKRARISRPDPDHRLFNFSSRRMAGRVQRGPGGFPAAGRWGQTGAGPGLRLPGDVGAFRSQGDRRVAKNSAIWTISFASGESSTNAKSTSEAGFMRHLIRSPQRHLFFGNTKIEPC